MIAPKTIAASRRSLLLAAAVLVLLLGAFGAQSASAAFGIAAFDGEITADSAHTPYTQAGGHPFNASTTIDFNTVTDEFGAPVPDGGDLRNVTASLPPGLIGDPTSVGNCAEASQILNSFIPDDRCPLGSIVGVAESTFSALGEPGNTSVWISPVYAMKAPFGSAARFGFGVASFPILLDASLRSDGDYGIDVGAANLNQNLSVIRSKITLWGTPGAPSHDDQRCWLYFDSVQSLCAGEAGSDFGPHSSGLKAPPAFITMPTRCTAPGVGLETSVLAESWNPASAPATASFFSHNPPGYPLARSEWGAQQGPTGCEEVPFAPTITAKPTTLAAQSPTGLDFSLDVHDEGLNNSEGLAQSDIKRVEVTLPEGFSANPSLAEGLNVCTEADLKRETVGSLPGVGCPNGSKIGTVEVQSPLLEESLNGAIFAAKPYDNPFGSLLALYIVIKNQARGVIVKQALEVRPDPVTGRLTTIADDLPQVPFSHFRLHFREGVRSPLASPPLCGAYNVEAKLTPWSGTAPVTSTSVFQIISGRNGGACPSGGTPPFKPGLVAGTINNAAGSYSPFNLRLNRDDGEQEFTRFSIKLPPGIVGKLAGIPFCSDAAIAAAKSRTGPNGGQEEIERPSCPAASEVGRTLAGAGVGPSLVYAPGKVYLAGPYNGSALSVAAITAAKVGPFDLGTVVVRQALKVNPETAEVFIDSVGSDPIPHIIDGIQVHARDIRVYVDKPEFVLNPTSCKRTSTASTVLGSGLNFASAADDQPLTVTSPFQAADCASLGFKPKLALRLFGGTKRGDNPRFKAVLNARPGDANIGKAQVTLPHSAFLDQSHIKTICTRVQFAQGTVPGESCPKASIYGYAKAVTPLLDEPLEGPVFLRSSSHNLPDLLVALHSGKINVNLAGRIDSVGDGQIRNTFEAVPDAPVTRFTLTMQGGKKGLLINSTNLCRSKNRATVAFTGQNGKKHEFNPVVKPQCGKKAKKNKKKR